MICQENAKLTACTASSAATAPASLFRITGCSIKVLPKIFRCLAQRNASVMAPRACAITA